MVCKNHLVGLNRVGPSYLEEMPERDYDGYIKSMVKGDGAP